MAAKPTESNEMAAEMAGSGVRDTAQTAEDLDVPYRDGPDDIYGADVERQTDVSDLQVEFSDGGPGLPGRTAPETRHRRRELGAPRAHAAGISERKNDDLSERRKTYFEVLPNDRRRHAPHREAKVQVTVKITTFTRGYSRRAQKLCNMKTQEMKNLHYAMIFEPTDEQLRKTGPGPDLVLPLCKAKFSRRIRVMICITMYAETPDELKKTFYGVADNIDEMVRDGLYDWDQIVVVLVTDGLSCANKGTLAWMESMNMYDDSVIDKAATKWGVDKTAAAVHSFESIVPLPKRDNKGYYHYPMQVVFYAKQNNRGKLDSHRWFFYGLADQLMPLINRESTSLLANSDGKLREMLYVADSAQILHGSQHADDEVRCDCKHFSESKKSMCSNSLISSGTPAWHSVDGASTTGGPPVTLSPACYTILNNMRKNSKTKPVGHGSAAGEPLPYFTRALDPRDGIPVRCEPPPGLDQEGGNDPLFVPKYFVILLDAGTQPGKSSLLKLVQAMRENDQVAGCCGELVTEKLDLANPVTAAQAFEYKISHVMDKSMESVFGYISVLPGACSAYAYNAIRRDQLVPDGADPKVMHLDPQAGPLVEYFKSLNPDPTVQTPFYQNMYLAEDRILCFALISMKNKNHILRYVKGAVATTDVPTSLVEILKQRRRWLNGATFATLYALGRFHLVWTQTNHSFFRKVALSVQLLYFIVTTVLSWFLLGTFYLTFALVVRAALNQSNDPAKLLGFALTHLYQLVTVGQFIIALSNKAAAAKTAYRVSSILYGGMTITSVLLAVLMLWNGANVDLFQKVALAIVSGSVFMCAAIHGELRTVLLTFLQYLFMVATMVTIFAVYAICNVDDISWGTKGLEIAHAIVGSITDADAEARAEQRAAAFKSFKSLVVFMYVGTNLAFVTGMYAFVDDFASYTNGLAWVVSPLLALRVFGSMLFMLQHCLTKLQRRGTTGGDMLLRKCARGCETHCLKPGRCIQPLSRKEERLQYEVPNPAHRDCCLKPVPRLAWCSRYRCACCKMVPVERKPSTDWMSTDPAVLRRRTAARFLSDSRTRHRDNAAVATA